MKSFRSIWLLTVFVATRALAQDDDGQSPMEKSVAGLNHYGAYNVTSTPELCSLSAAMKYVGPKFLRDDFAIPTGTPRYVGDDLRQFTAILNDAYSVLGLSGDLAVRRHYICVGLYDYHPTPNAMSYSQGYIAIDPRIVESLYQSGTTHAVSFLLLHEFGHQLQYWFGTRMTYYPTTRGVELTADCIGAALDTMRWWRSKQALDEHSMNAMLASIAAMGNYDFHNPYHHGTPYQRMRATVAGVNLVKSYYQKRRTQLPSGITALDLVNACGEFVQKTDEKYGENWPPIPNTWSPGKL